MSDTTRARGSTGSFIVLLGAANSPVPPRDEWLSPTGVGMRAGHVCTYRPRGSLLARTGVHTTVPMLLPIMEPLGRDLDARPPRRYKRHTPSLPHSPPSTGVLGCGPDKLQVPGTPMGPRNVAAFLEEEGKTSLSRCSELYCIR